MRTDCVLVTGTSSGIGLEVAVGLAEAGFRVYATMRDITRRQDLDAESARRNVRLDVLPLDTTDPASIDAAVRTVVDREGGIYGLVNNAGILMRGYFEDVSDEEMRRTFETNVFGTMAVTRAVLPFLRAARRGRIVFMSSTGGRIASPAASAYCASKFALEGLAESLALEVAPFGVHVSLVEPGFIATNLFAKNGHIAARALDPAGAYYRWFQKLQAIVDREVRKTGIPPAAAGVSVRRALCDRRPRRRYVVGRRGRVLIALRRHLPGELFDRLWLRAIVRRTTR